jgi:hypothetical protein
MELIIQLIGGLIGGNATGAVAKNLSLGTVGNSIAGLIGGVGGGQIINMLLSGGGAAAADAAAAASGMDIGSIVSGLAGGGVGGVILTVIAGIVKRAMAK